MLCSVWAVRRVALLAEGVDRNIVVTLRAAVLPVALLAEGVDRNWSRASKPPECKPSPSSRRAWIEILPECQILRHTLVALLAEGVDRNANLGEQAILKKESPSSRRAWIEISRELPRGRCGPVALLAEGVDRNLQLLIVLVLQGVSPSSRRAWIEIRWSCDSAGRAGSPSSRRAWIEIRMRRFFQPARQVALLAEGVDRNRGAIKTPVKPQGRPPRGGRG